MFFNLNTRQKESLADKLKDLGNLVFIGALIEKGLSKNFSDFFIDFSLVIIFLLLTYYYSNKLLE